MIEPVAYIHGVNPPKDPKPNTPVLNGWVDFEPTGGDRTEPLVSAPAVLAALRDARARASTADDALAMLEVELEAVR